MFRFKFSGSFMKNLLPVNYTSKVFKVKKKKKG